MNAPRFAHEVCVLIHQFLQQIAQEAVTRNEAACILLADQAGVHRRRALLLEQDFRGLLDDGVFGKGVLAVSSLQHVSDTSSDREAADNIWIRHVLAFERSHDIAFELGVDAMVDEWTRLNDLPQLREARVVIAPPRRVSSMLFDCMVYVVDAYVFDNPWAAMPHLLSQLQAYEAKQELLSATVDALVELHVSVGDSEQEPSVLTTLKNMFVYGAKGEQTDAPPVLLKPNRCRQTILEAEDSPEGEGSPEAAGDSPEANDVTVSTVNMVGQAGLSIEQDGENEQLLPCEAEESDIDLMTTDEMLEYQRSLQYMLSPITIDPDLELDDVPLATVTAPKLKALYRHVHRRSSLSGL